MPDVGPAAAARTHRVVERAGELRIGSKGVALGRLHTCSHRRAVQPRGQLGGRVGDDLGRVSARKTLQCVLESGTNQCKRVTRWVLNATRLPVSRSRLRTAN